MLQQFRIKEGGAGNVISKAQQDYLEMPKLVERNNCVSGTPSAPAYIRPLVLLTRNTYTDQMYDLLQKFRKVEPVYTDLNEVYAEVRDIFTRENAPNFLIIYAQSLLLNKTLIHYNQKPKIEEDENGSFVKESNKLLLSNGGVISAIGEDSPCIFYHPFAWKYLTKQIELLVTWRVEYLSSNPSYGNGLFESCAQTSRGYFYGFAPFGRKRGNSEDEAISALTKKRDSSLNINGVWGEYPDYYWFQMREGISSVKIKNAPFKYNLYNALGVYKSEFYDTGEGNDVSFEKEETIGYVPIFIVRTSSMDAPIPRSFRYYDQDGNRVRIAIGTADCMTSLEKLQRVTKLKTPFFRSVQKENIPELTEDSQCSYELVRDWISSNIIPPHMTEDEWWSLFIESLKITGVRICGEYSSNGKVCGVVYGMPKTSTRLAEYEPCDAILEESDILASKVVLRTKERTSDYLEYYSAGMAVENADQFLVNSDIKFSMGLEPYLKISIRLNVADGWQTLPDNVVRTAIKNSINGIIENALYSDANLTTLLGEDGTYYQATPTETGANIPIGQFFNVDVDNEPLSDLIETLKTGWVGYVPYLLGNGTYVSVGVPLGELTKDWMRE